MRRISGFKNLVHDAIEKTTDLVQQTQQASFARPLGALRMLEASGTAAGLIDGVHRAIGGVVYGAIHAVNDGLRAAGDAALAAAARATGADDEVLSTPMLSTAPNQLSFWVDTAQSAVNALHGDFLRERGSGLAIPMSVRVGGRAVAPERAALAAAFPRATGKLCVFVHGLGCTEWEWCMSAHHHHGDPEVSFGTLLQRDLGYTPVYVRYNTGLHVADNGRQLAALLSRLAAEWPCQVERVALVGHSMGGLVARSAAHYGSLQDDVWVTKLRHVFCLASPHLGAPLEKAVNVLASVLRRIESAGAQVPAKILNARSAGIKDLRFGYVVDEDWQGRDPDALLDDGRTDVPCVDGATYCWIGATITKDPAHPLGRILGDALVRPASAAGAARDPARHVPFQLGRMVPGMHHLRVQNHPAVYAVILRWLAEI